MHWTSVMFSIYHPVVTPVGQLTGLNPIHALISIYHIQHAIRETLYLDCGQVYSSHPEIWVN